MRDNDVMVSMSIDNLATAVEKVAIAIERLGLNDASTGMGAIELLAKEVRDASERMATSYDGSG